MVGRPSWAPGDVDLDQPSVARVYDFYLGGSHNFASDRVFAERVLQAFPEMRDLARENRRALHRMVRYLCGVGIDQFLDLGSGIPTKGNVHDIADEANPGSRVVYVDHDPVAVVHSRHLLEGNDRATAVLADARDASRVLALAAEAGLDLDRPVAVLAVALLHFFADADDPAQLVARYMAALPAGSHLAITHGSRTGPSAIDALAQVYGRADSPNVVRLRTPEEIRVLFGGLDLVAPGLVPLPRWRPDPTDGEETDVPDDYPTHCGVGRRTRSA